MVLLGHDELVDVLLPLDLQFLEGLEQLFGHIGRPGVVLLENNTQCGICTQVLSFDGRLVEELQIGPYQRLILGIAEGGGGIRTVIVVLARCHLPPVNPAALQVVLLYLRQRNVGPAHVAGAELTADERLRLCLGLLLAKEDGTALRTLLYVVVDLDLGVGTQQALVLILAVREVAGDRLDVLLGDYRASRDALLQRYPADDFRGQATLSRNPLKVPCQLRLVQRVGGNACKRWEVETRLVTNF